MALAGWHLLRELELQSGAAACEKVGSLSFYSALSINVTFCTMGQLSAKAQGWAGTSLHGLCRGKE